MCVTHSVPYHYRGSLFFFLHQEEVKCGLDWLFILDQLPANRLDLISGDMQI